MIYKVEEGFTENEINPITNMPYDNSCIIFCLTTSDEYQMLNGGSTKFAYTLKVSKNYVNWRMAVVDFIKFQESYGKNIILSISDGDLKEAKMYYKGHHYNDKYLREYEPDVLIHSTTSENWANIQKDGCLKSWNILKSEQVNWECSPIGSCLGDPIDFSDYIMFSSGAISSEIVVLSKQNGEIVMNQDMQYKTGARLYFDIKKIAQDGLLIRDGCHLKVRDRLQLQPYLLWIADWKSVGLENEFSTPKEFTGKSNTKFNHLFNGQVMTTF